jgi:hypothetical protein
VCPPLGLAILWHQRFIGGRWDCPLLLCQAAGVRGTGVGEEGLVDDVGAASFEEAEGLGPMPFR